MLPVRGRIFFLMLAGKFIHFVFGDGFFQVHGYGFVINGLCLS
jgi:hypothetical protein